MKKSPAAYRTISEVSDWLDEKPHVLRFWESKFSQVRPMKRAGGRRYYSPNDMLLIGGIKKLLHDDGMTIKGVQKLLSQRGIAHVSSLSRPLDGASIKQADSVPTIKTDSSISELADPIDIAGDNQAEIASALSTVTVASEVDSGSLKPETKQSISQSLLTDCIALRENYDRLQGAHIRIEHLLQRIKGLVR